MAGRLAPRRGTPFRRGPFHLLRARGLLLAAPLALAACRSGPAAPGAADEPAADSPRTAATSRDVVDPGGRPPEDFTIDVAILQGPRVPDQAEAHLRAGHFILFADGSLHHDSGRTVTWGQRPGRTRTLYQQQVTDLWSLASQLGFTSPDNADPPANPALLVPGRTQMIYVLAFSGGGERWTFVRRFDTPEAADPAAVRLIRALAELAWMTDLPADRFLPVRYDFGPDPYRGFRVTRAAAP